MNNKPWFETASVPEDALAAFRSYQRDSDEKLAEIIDRKLDPTSPNRSIFPSAKQVRSRRVLEVMLFTLESMELKELEVKNQQLDQKRFFTNYYDAFSDEEIPTVFNEFQEKLSLTGCRIHGLGNPDNPKSMRDYMTKVQCVLKNSKFYKGPTPL